MNINLGRKPSGCVIWVMFDAGSLALGPFLWLGGPPSEKLPDLGERMARHTKADATGKKAERPDLRVVRRSRFKEFVDMDALLSVLF